MSTASNSQNAIENTPRQTRIGVLTGIGCYVLWGLFPLYWRLLDNVDSLEIVAHRMIWCFVFMAVVCLVLKKNFVALLRQPRARHYLIPAAIIVTINWSTYIIAVNSGHVVEAAMGYYINPLVSIVLGMVVFKERLSVLEWIAVALCCIGIGYFVIANGIFPWIGLLLAVSFGVYGAIKKKGAYPAVEAIAVESTVMLPFAIVFTVVLAAVTGTHGFLGDVGSAEGWSTTLLLIGGGAVTAIPLVLFAQAANSIPLSLLGFMQYVSPTLALLIGVFAFHEPFTQAHAVCFGFIWAGLALVTLDSILRSRKMKRELREWKKSA